MPDYAHLVTEMTEQSGVSFRPASSTDVAELASLGVPESVLSFYRTFEPSAQVDGPVAIYTIPQIVEENREYVGRFTARYGYVAFAQTFCHDVYCFDIHHLSSEGEPRIVLICHEIVDDQSTAEYVGRIAKPVAASLHEFLGQWLRDEIDQECVYG